MGEGIGAAGRDPESMASTAAVRRLLVGSALLAYGATFAAFATLEFPGLGIGHFFYVAIVLVALATGPVAGVAAGLGGAALYVLGVLLNPSIPPAEVVTISTAIRLLTFAGIGAVIGWFARENRTLVARLEILADRDSLTGLPNTRCFERAITRRLEAGEPFGLLIGDIDRLKTINEMLGRAEGDDAIRRLADRLAGFVGPEAEPARAGDDEFAVLPATRRSHELARLASRLESDLADGCAGITFGWALHPRDGVDALSLYRAADERLYTRKFVRRPVDALDPA